MNGFSVKGVRAIALFFACLSALTATLYLSGVRISVNVSGSLPWKVFVGARGTDISCGPDAVGLFRLNVENPYWKYGTLFAKRFVGCPGDALATKGKDFYLNGKKVVAATERDSEGEEVGIFRFDGVIPERRYFVLGDGPTSYDSRYWGFVKKSWVVARGFPLF